MDTTGRSDDSRTATTGSAVRPLAQEIARRDPQRLTGSFGG
jgi:hypothetical protein